jgi:putative ABC transport system substrate-binding protein
MRRREFIAGLGAAAVPLVARAQQGEHVRRIGVLVMSDENNPVAKTIVSAFTQALADLGWTDGQNVALEIHFASGKLDRLPALADDLVRRRVDVIVAYGLPAAVAAKAATDTVPIVFAIGEDPLNEGIVASLNRPGGNATGFTGFSNQLMAKRLDLLHRAVPRATVIGFLVNPDNTNADPNTRDARAAALASGLTLRVLTAASVGDFERVFSTVSQERIGALLVGVEPFFWAAAEELTALAAQHAVPAFYDRSLFPAVGGLMSYGARESELDRPVAAYVSRILRGTKPGDLPVQQPTKFEFVINLKTAKALGLNLPPDLVAIADEVIE